MENVHYDMPLNEDDFYAGGIKPKGQGPKGTRYVCTCWDMRALGCWDANDVHYSIQGREIAPTTAKLHLQCYVWFRERIRITALIAKYPFCRNWEIAKGSPWQNFVYCSKDGDFVEQGTRPKEPKAKDLTFKEALNAGTYQKGIEIIRDKRPRDYVLHGDAIERNLKRAYKTPFVHKFKEFNIGFQILDKPTLIWGTTGLGKTHYAAAHFEKPLIVSHMDDLKKFCAIDYDGIVFDDMSFVHYPPESVIHLLDSEFERSIHVRYVTAEIPAGTRKIFTHNTENPFYKDDIPEQQKEAIERRFNICHVYNKLY